MNFLESQYIDTSMELHPSQLTGPVSRSRMTSSTPHPLNPNTQPLPRYTAPIFAIAGESTLIRFLSSCDSGSTGSVSCPSPTTTNVTLDIWGEERQRIASGRQSFYGDSRNVKYPSKGLHPSQFEFRQTSQPSWIGPTAPVLTTGGETTSTHFVSSPGSGYTTERLSSSREAFNGHIVAGSIVHSGTLSPNPAEIPWGTPVNPGDVGSTSTDTNVQPVQPSSTPQIIELDEEEVTCLMCKGTFHGYQARSHLRENHPDLVHKSDKLLCPLCTTTPAKEVTNFCRHFQKHHKVVRYKCSGCSYEALERWNVDRHVRKKKCVKD